MERSTKESNEVRERKGEVISRGKEGAVLEKLIYFFVTWDPHMCRDPIIQETFIFLLWSCSILLFILYTILCVSYFRCEMAWTAEAESVQIIALLI